MRKVIRVLCTVIAVATALGVIASAAVAPSSTRSEIQLELGDLLFSDERYGEAISVYLRAKEGAEADQLIRASAGLLRSLLLAAEFNRAYQEALFFESLDHRANPELRTLSADGFWGYGLFDEADRIYDEVLAQVPSSPRARHGLARGLAARNLHAEALTEIQAAIALSPTDPILHYTHGMILRGLRRYDAAAEALDQYIA
ncbi:MAG TPA: tetratricopeptide repeat protein, partial [Acidobacteria bacterium]|nr:tetratricopeptide repeat protein [Acidobacteriota bacterium]